MAEKRIKLSIIIVSYNTRQLLEKCLHSVISNWLLVVSNRPPVTNHQLPITEIIVVDNGSTDGSVEMVKKSLSTSYQSPITIHLIEGKENLGFGGGNNVGIKQAKGEYIMFLNSDTVVKDGAIKKLVDYLDNEKDIDIIGPRLLNSDGTLQPNCGKFPNLSVVFLMLFCEHFIQGTRLVRWAPKKSEAVDWLMGAAFICRRKVIETIGGFDEKMFMYMEEVEWFFRANKKNFKTFCLIESEIFHLGRGSSKNGKTEPILNIYKGLLYFYKKHYSLFDQFLVIILLKLKAFFSLFIGIIKNDAYLKQTYGQAIKYN